jgi:hypothetical protein
MHSILCAGCQLAVAVLYHWSRIILIILFKNNGYGLLTKDMTFPFAEKNGMQCS